MRNAGKSDLGKAYGSDSRVSLFDNFEVSGIGLVFEEQAWAEGYKLVAGLDEVGRGCLAGPVVTAACILDPNKSLPEGLDDSKKLSEAVRYEIAARLKADCIAFSIGQIEAEEIDRINILEATKQAMLNAVASLTPEPDFLLIDALYLKRSPLPQKSIIKGDSISASIAAASILAKTYRDDLMKAYDTEYPQYGFAGHKGYGAATHLEALRIHGPCILHRKTFRGVLPGTQPPSAATLVPPA
ncbi:MAG TPA: ribonuclease HII [Pyrinomonadaceae bacterium]|nr:ribonuclease HII [Acidobacteriota bacterium]HQZ95947.1 ribonuclease HII [Pyrinomonadaceae bacterium]